MNKGKYSIIYKKDNYLYKICKIIFAKDGSFFVTSPYHPINKATVGIMSFRYGKHGEMMRIPIKSMGIDCGYLDDDGRLKLSHHPDGYAQFSGAGVISGKDEKGKPKGIGIQSWPLENPPAGPAFTITLLGLEQFKSVETANKYDCIFDDKFLPPTEKFSDFENESKGFVLEGYYFESNRRNFIQTDVNGERFILYWHPTGLAMKLNVLLPMEKCEIQGFIGVRLYPIIMSWEKETCVFVLNSSAGDLDNDSTGNSSGAKDGSRRDGYNDIPWVSFFLVMSTLVCYI